MLDFLTGVQSQLNNILLFRNIFSMRKTLKRAFLLPLDYYSRSGKASLPPLAINLLVTLRCNAHCKVCSFRDVLNIGVDELTIDEIKKFVQDIARHKPSIFLGGGEPFIRKDIFEIIRVIKGYGLACGIITNGLLLDENKIQQLIALNVEYIAFSLHGPEEIHDGITGIKGAYKRLL
ncbi:MAG: radical SAM protein, partial [Candidatus Omnitrophota bacterium]